MMRRTTYRRTPRRGFALLDVIIGGMMLGIGIAATITIASRSLVQQAEGERQLVASWLADELLNMVMVEGPDIYPKINDTVGQFEAPFELYEYELDIHDQGPRQPFRVTAYVRWPVQQGYHEVVVETIIAVRLGEELVPRVPITFMDREARYFDDDS